MTDELFDRMHASNVSDEVPEPRKENFALFNEPWCKEFFSRSDFYYHPFPNRRPAAPSLYKWCSNSMISETLWSNDSIRALCMFTLSTSPNPHHSFERYTMIAIGTGTDGMTGRGHGALVSTLFDFCMGWTAMHVMNANATVKLEVEYKKPIKTPCLLLGRCKVDKIERRSCWLTGVLEDGNGNVFATGKSLFARPKGFESNEDPRGTKFSEQAEKSKL